ncbi:threonine ammonia-lyase [Leucobacter sp. OH2974_COT-288]|uniref:L-threonine dehydratase catabolic TdcB n=1 Tax=Canibacter oris TaxID=1365628 RepID=A0A840DEC8_9MICO|nr:threonine ammonia-lyase [Canibacter oris]MBB4071000.1 threonine dehydratase [Canibacter oris]RRD36485.1 threonine ammonia-lyase [Leucobacter sp. OH2974_COT-288]
MAADNYVPPTLERFQDTLAVVGAAVQRTPLVTSHFLAETIDAQQVYLKCENLQRTGSYKLRGAYNHICSLSEQQRSKGVVAASAGNHAQGVAYAAKRLGIKATIFMPLGVALPKLQATRNYGANVQLVGVSVEESLAAAKAFAADTGAHFVPPFDDDDVIAGQGTIALEMLQDAPEITTLVAPIGGGGLISGVAAAAKQWAAANGRQLRVIGVHAENAAAVPPSLAAGHPVTIETKPTIADGIAVARPGTLNFEVIKDFVDEVVTVSDDDIARAIVLMLERSKMLVEPAGAAGVAALLSGKISATGQTVATVLSGGNIDPLLLQRVIGHGLAAASRYLKLRILLPDRPGQLVRTAEIVAGANANVVEVIHTRHATDLPISDVELELHIETRGAEHGREVTAALEDAGYRVRAVASY